jgi:hypothetical protein
MSARARPGTARAPLAPQPTGAPATVAALQVALAAQHAAVYGYGVAGAHLGGRRQLAATRGWNAHRAQRDHLTALLAAAGARPVASADAYQLPFPVASARDAARLVVALEDGVIRSYLGLVALPDQRLRAFGALAMQDAAVRAAAWRGSTVAFPGLPPSALTPLPRPARRGTPAGH